MAKCSAVTPFDEELQCPVCYDSVVEPTLLNCEHLFCQVCVAPLERCPTCRVAITSRAAAPPVLRNMAMRVAVRCEHCEWSGTREQSLTHRCPVPKATAGLHARNEAANRLISELHETIKRKDRELEQLKRNLALPDAKPCSDYRRGFEGLYYCNGKCNYRERGQEAYGDGLYHPYSNVCRAARHAGAIGETGNFAVVRRKPLKIYTGTLRNNIQTVFFERRYLDTEETYSIAIQPRGASSSCCSVC
jgi:hypothetical protein